MLLPNAFSSDPIIVQGRHEGSGAGQYCSSPAIDVLKVSSPHRRLPLCRRLAQPGEPFELRLHVVLQLVDRQSQSRRQNVAC
jgi:hypothetical protein